MKSTHWVTIALTLLLGLLPISLVACGVDSPSASSPPSLTSEEPIATSDSTPLAITAANRVVALTPLTADIVQQLDRQKLVGIPGNELLRQDTRFAGITTVSGGQTPPNLEQIIALEPDFVVGAAGFHDQVLQRLEALNIDTLLTNVDSWQSLNRLTQTLATAIDADPKPLLNRYETFLSDLPQSAKSTLVLISQQPILSPNKTSWAGDLLRQFRAKNLTAELQGQSPFGGYITLSPEKILEANPEILILVDTGDNILQQFQSQPFWSQLQAVKDDRIHVFDYYGLVNPGSIGKIEQACTQLRAALSS
jgi:iron complex transport system substrate-binding protein